MAEIQGILKDKINGTWKLGHVEWDEEVKKWRNRKPINMPRVLVEVEVLGNEHMAIIEDKNLERFQDGALQLIQELR